MFLYSLAQPNGEKERFILDDAGINLLLLLHHPSQPGNLEGEIYLHEIPCSLVAQAEPYSFSELNRTAAFPGV